MTFFDFLDRQPLRPRTRGKIAVIVGELSPLLDQGLTETQHRAGYSQHGPVYAQAWALLREWAEGVGTELPDAPWTAVPPVNLGNLLCDTLQIQATSAYAYASHIERMVRHFDGSAASVSAQLVNVAPPTASMMTAAWRAYVRLAALRGIAIPDIPKAARSTPRSTTPAPVPPVPATAPTLAPPAGTLPQPLLRFLRALGAHAWGLDTALARRLTQLTWTDLDDTTPGVAYLHIREVSGAVFMDDLNTYRTWAEPVGKGSPLFYIAPGVPILPHDLIRACESAAELPKPDYGARGTPFEAVMRAAQEARHAAAPTISLKTLPTAAPPNPLKVASALSVIPTMADDVPDALSAFPDLDT